MVHVSYEGEEEVSYEGEEEEEEEDEEEDDDDEDDPHYIPRKLAHIFFNGRFRSTAECKQARQYLVNGEAIPASTIEKLVETRNNWTCKVLNRLHYSSGTVAFRGYIFVVAVHCIVFSFVHKAFKVCLDITWQSSLSGQRLAHIPGGQGELKLADPQKRQDVQPHVGRQRFKHVVPGERRRLPRPPAAVVPVHRLAHKHREQHKLARRRA